MQYEIKFFFILSTTLQHYGLLLKRKKKKYFNILRRKKYFSSLLFSFYLLFYIVCGYYGFRMEKKIFNNVVQFKHMQAEQENFSFKSCFFLIFNLFDIFIGFIKLFFTLIFMFSCVCLLFVFCFLMICV